MNRPSRRWRRSSLSVLCCLIAVASAAGVQADEGLSVVLFPLQSHWLSEPLANATTQALGERLADAGHAVTEVTAESSVVQLAISEGWLSSKSVESGRLQSQRLPLGVAIGADGVLYGEIVEREGEVEARLTIESMVARKDTMVVTTAESRSDIDEMAAELAVAVVARLTPEFRAEVGLDAAGMQAGAMERYAAGAQALSEGMYREAVLEFDAALLGEPRNLDYLRAAAKAREALGDYDGAVIRMRSLAAVSPSDAEIALQLGEAALLAGDAKLAQSAFLSAAEQLGNDARVVEGLALSARVLGQPERAQEYYQLLVPMIPELTDAPEWLPEMLAMAEESVRLSATAPDDLPRLLGALYLTEGRTAEGIAALLRYHEGEERPSYENGRYYRMAMALDAESEAVARAAQEVFSVQALGQITADEASEEMDRIHDRSDTLATLVECMTVSPVLDPAHRYRVLAYNLLNQSNFESLLYLRTRDAERQRRAELLRAAFRKSREQAQTLMADLLASEPAA